METGAGGSCCRELDKVGNEVRLINRFASIIFEPATTAENELEGLLGAEALALVRVDQQGETTEGTGAVHGLHSLARDYGVSQ